MTELVILLLAAIWLFMLVVVAVLRAFDFIANAFPSAYSQFEETNAKPDKSDERT